MTAPLTGTWNDDGSWTWKTANGSGTLDAVDVDRLIRSLENGGEEARKVAEKFKRNRRMPVSDEALT